MPKRSPDGVVPGKVKRVRLLQALGFPLNPGTIVLDRSDLLSRKSGGFLGAARGLLRAWPAVIVRTAWHPDGTSSPYFHIRSDPELVQISAHLKRLLEENTSCTHLILHGEVVDARDAGQRARFLAGRLLLHPERDLPREKTLEVVAGEYFAKILDGTSPRHVEGYAMCVKHVAATQWEPTYVGKSVSREDMNLALRQLSSISDQIELLTYHLAADHNARSQDLFLALEFACCRETESVFIVFDYDFATSPTGHVQ
jgi:hypothetical protein